MGRGDHREPGVVAALSIPVTELIYELLDAHDDTACLASELVCDPDWRAHLDYLRRLQRTGREMLAHFNASTPL